MHATAGDDPWWHAGTAVLVISKGHQGGPSPAPHPPGLLPDPRDSPYGRLLVQEAEERVVEGAVVRGSPPPPPPPQPGAAGAATRRRSCVIGGNECLPW